MDFTAHDSLSFDCYGTLIDWERGLAATLRPIVTASGRPLSDDDVLEAYAGIEKRLEASSPITRYSEIVSRAAAEFGAAIEVDVSDEMALAIGASVGTWPAFPDSAEALARLAHHYRLIILSNVDRASFAGSNPQLGVTFDAILTAEDIGSYKPNPKNFEALLAKVDEMGIPRDRHLHVAQSLFHDHDPAKDVGLSTVWINRRANRPGLGATPAAAPVEPDAAFVSMVEFADAVDQAFSEDPNA